MPTLLIEQPDGVRYRQVVKGRECSPLEEIYKNLGGLGYDVAHSLEHAFNYGIPQHRARVLICASISAPVPFIVGQDRKPACNGECIGITKPCFKHGFDIGHPDGKLTVCNLQHKTGVAWHRGYCGTITCSSRWVVTPAATDSRSLPGAMCISNDGYEALQGFPLGHTSGLLATQRATALGNALIPEMLVEPLKRLVAWKKGKSADWNWNAIQVDGNWTPACGGFRQRSCKR